MCVCICFGCADVSSLLEFVWALREEGGTCIVQLQQKASELVLSEWTYFLSPWWIVLDVLSWHFTNRDTIIQQAVFNLTFVSVNKIHCAFYYLQYFAILILAVDHTCNVLVHISHSDGALFYKSIGMIIMIIMISHGTFYLPTMLQIAILWPSLF